MTQYLSGKHQVQYGTSQIDFELIHTEREKLAVHVYPDSSVVVEAPLDSTLDEIKQKIYKRAKWIIKQQNTFQDYSRSEPNRMYVSGETHYYLGRRYRIKVIQADFERVQFNRGRIFLSVSMPNEWERKHDLMTTWYKARAKFIFRNRLKSCYAHFEDLGIPYPDLQIRAMASRWGSYTPSGKIILNLKLIKVPKKLIDYVIIHELCHLKEHNHSQSFYNLLDQRLPNWKILRERLNHYDFS